MEIKYCYLHFKVFPEFVRAALLITDEKTKPLEFRITSKIEIDQLQKILYGESLKDALFIDKIGKELLDSAQTDYNALLIKEKELFGIRDYVKKLTLLIQKYDEFRGVDKFSLRLQSQNPKFPPILIKYFPKDEEQVKNYFKYLQDSFKHYNLMEPFERIEKAIDFLNQQEENAKTT